jgi:hypothetical protein
MKRRYQRHARPVEDAQQLKRICGRQIGRGLRKPLNCELAGMPTRTRERAATIGEHADRGRVVTGVI